MNKEQNIQAELESISSYIAAMPRTMPYVVPLGYFEQFGASVKEHVTHPWGQTLPYAVPAGYFDSVANEIAAIANEDTLNQSKTSPYTIPTGYFDTLPEQILRTVNAADKTTNSTAQKQHSILKPLRWAAAAIVVLGIGIGAYVTVFNAQQDIGADKILASVPNSEIQDYVQGTYRVDVNRIVSNNNINDMSLDNNDIIDYLDETGWD